MAVDEQGEKNLMILSFFSLIDTSTASKPCPSGRGKKKPLSINASISLSID